ncbi:gdp-mannose 4 [Quercus suber]|uniref:GDP-mannose 4,6-dehydratase n=1 Tax=Quercus suber TaxID=58331 RepID=A0AAW0M8U3_QUESU
MLIENKTWKFQLEIKLGKHKERKKDDLEREREAYEINKSRSGSTTNGESPPCAPHKVALITGITSQDGFYLIEFLLDKGYEQINHIYIDPHNAHKAQMKLYYTNLTDASSLRRWLDTILPDEVYNLAAQSHVAASFDIPDYTANVVATEALHLLEAI